LSTGIIDKELTRRELLEMAALGGAALAVSGRRWTDEAWAAEPPIVKPLPAEWFIPLGSNAEMRWDAARDLGYTVPNARFFVRNHTATPRIDATTWALRVAGNGVNRPRAFSYRHLERLAHREVTCSIECAGNGRRFFDTQQGTPAPGTQWGLGAIGVARWRGVPLRELLERAGLRRDAVDVMPEGLDQPVIADGVDHGHVRRPLPLAKALDDALVAVEMNGEELPPDHGFPARLVVPRWIGVASVKWLGSIEVATQPLSSPWNTKWYRGLAEQPVKSAFELGWDASVPRGATLHGRSWSGHGAIRRVEVSADGGTSWRRARLRGPNRPRAWVRWEIDASPPGRRELLARATDRTGTVQPATVPFNENGYQFWAVVRHPVQIS
jgi:DMSO/TMAO reductase YedYZ molybdopterin-dependent catalytic subunit